MAQPTPPPHSPEKTFELPLQLTVEQLITDNLLVRLQAALPQGARIRRLTGADQVHGDLEVSLGSQQVYVELKAEDYSRSLFAEPIQFWVQKEGVATYRRSWAYTTTAHWMLYLSVRTGTLLLCPRRQWLSTGLHLLDAYLLQNIARGRDVEPYRPYATLNTRMGQDGKRHFSGGAAGSGIDTWTWLQGYAAQGHDPSQVLLADGRELLDAARAKVNSWTDEWLQKYVSERVDARQLARPGVFANVVREVRQWAAAAHPDESAEALRIRRTLHGVGGQSEASLQALARTLTAPVSDEARQPLRDPMWFQATACLQCGWTQRPKDGSRAIVDEALATTFRLNKAGLPKGQDVPAGMLELRMRFSAKDFTAHGPRPSWEGLKDWFALPDAKALDAKREYVRMFRHPA